MLLAREDGGQFAQLELRADNVAMPGTLGLGLGTTQPREKLEVNGNITISNTALSKAARMGIDEHGLWIEPNESQSGIRLEANPTRTGLYVRGTDGNVGIGTYSPTQLLTLEAPEGTRLEIARTSASLPWSQASGEVNPGSFVINQQSRGSSQPSADFALKRDRKNRLVLRDSNTFLSSQDGGLLAFFANLDEEGGRELMRITETGNVGIGTTSVYNPQGWNKVLEVLGTSHARFNVRSSGGVVTSMFSHDNWVGPRGVIGTDSGHPLTFATGYAHQMTIDTSGNVGIGTHNPIEKLHVVGGRIHLEKAGTAQGLDLRADGSALDLESNGAALYINYNNRPVHIRNLQSGSSREWKEDIAEFSREEATQVLKHLNPVTFRFKEDESCQRHLGFVAEEMPASVATADRKAFSPIAIISVLTKVVQEQQEEIAALQGDVASLKDRAK